MATGLVHSELIILRGQMLTQRAVFRDIFPKLVRIISRTNILPKVIAR